MDEARLLLGTLNLSWLRSARHTSQRARIDLAFDHVFVQYAFETLTGILQHNMLQVMEHYLCIC